MDHAIPEVPQVIGECRKAVRKVVLNELLEPGTIAHAIGIPITSEGLNTGENADEAEKRRVVRRQLGNTAEVDAVEPAADIAQSVVHSLPRSA